MFSFNVLGGIFCGVEVLAKILTMTNIFSINTSLSTGLIILGGVSFMMGVFASVVFKRQFFAEKDLRHYLENSDMLRLENQNESNVTKL